MNTSKKINLLGLTQRELENSFGLGEPKFRAVQTLKWIHKHGCLDFDQMSDLSEALRKKLHNIASLRPPLIHHQMKSKDGTIKYLIQIESGSIVEMVRIPQITDKPYVFPLRLDVHYSALFVQLAPKVLRLI